MIAGQTAVETGVSILAASRAGGSNAQEGAESRHRWARPQQFDFNRVSSKEIMQNTEKAASQHAESSITYTGERKRKKKERGKRDRERGRKEGNDLIPKKR